MEHHKHTHILNLSQVYLYAFIINAFLVHIRACISLYAFIITSFLVHIRAQHIQWNVSMCECVTCMPNIYIFPTDGLIWYIFYIYSTACLHIIYCILQWQQYVFFTVKMYMFYWKFPKRGKWKRIRIVRFLTMQLHFWTNMITINNKYVYFNF